MADDFQAVLSVDKKSLTVSRKDGGVMPDTIVDAVSGYTSRAGKAAWEVLVSAANVVEGVDKAFADTMRAQALVYYNPPAPQPEVGSVKT